MTRALTALPVLLLLAACNGSTDPATGTVFDNFRNLQSGEFDRQIASKRAQADAIVAENNRRRANIGALERQRAANSGTLSSLRGQLSSVRSEISSARAAARGDQAKLARLNALEGQTRSVEADVARGGNASVAASELDGIRRAIRALSG